MGFLSMAYGLLVYVFFLATFLYAIAFVGNLWVPKSIDIGAASGPVEALLVNLALLAVFALQHSIMARRSFKRWWSSLLHGRRTCWRESARRPDRIATKSNRTYSTPRRSCRIAKGCFTVAMDGCTSIYGKRTAPSWSPPACGRRTSNWPESARWPTPSYSIPSAAKGPVADISD